MTMEQLMSYHSNRTDALCPGHPEIEHKGVEVTTGPLGQGVANAVGLAVASKNLAATFNQPGFPVVDNHTWCMIGDACLQEGVALEAISLAGHWRLSNLTIMYDNNQVTCDGSVDLANTEDVNAKMRACGWDVLEIEDGNHDIEGIVKALQTARGQSPTGGKPTFINIKTTIGLGSKVAGTAPAHGAAFGADDVANMKKNAGFNPDEHFVIGDETRQFFKGLPERGQKWVQEYDELLASYAQAHPDLAARFAARRRGEIPENWKDLIPKSFPDKPTSTRAANGLVLNPMAEKIDSFIVGTADLSPSVYMDWPGKTDFQHPSLRTQCGINGAYSGRYIHYGVREHAMAAISNGLAAYHRGTFIPVTSSFFMFYLYASPAVRMGALQRLQVIHAATHDSVGMGEDGPTHQPIELAALFRAMPNLLYLRPGDVEETAGAWEVAIQAKETPSIISTSRHALPLQKATRRDMVAKGAYVLHENEGASVTLIGVGAELCHAVDVAARLKEAHGVEARVVSMPCQRLFSMQDRGYQRHVLRRDKMPAIAIEPYAPNGWERYADAAACVSRFGHSLPGKEAYKYFGFDTEALIQKVLKYFDMVREDEMLRREFVEL